MEDTATTTVIHHTVPTKFAIAVRVAIFECLLSKNDNDGIVYAYIRDNSNLTIEQIRYKLRDEKEIHRRPDGIRRIAKWCNLDYKK